MKRITVKKFFTLLICIVILFANISLAAVVSDNDGAAFVTRSEFDTLRSNFQKQINDYNVKIDSLIDTAIASYLSGIATVVKGTFNSVDIEGYNEIQWRDKLLLPCTTRTWTSAATKNADVTNQLWEATYDEFLQADNGNEDVVATNVPVFVVWTTFAPYGYGGAEFLFKADAPQIADDGNRYWIALRNSTAGKPYWQPSCPLIYYRYDKYKVGDLKNEQRLKGWIECGACFTGITSGMVDCSQAPDGTTYTQNNAIGNNMNTLKSLRYAEAGTPGRTTNCFGIKLQNSTAASILGIRPTKASTEYFPRWQNIYNQHATHCQYLKPGDSYPKTYPINIGYKAANINETNEYLCKMMCGSENNQEVNYFIESNEEAFWTNGIIIWPEDCFKTFTLTNFAMRKMPIYAHPGGTWENGRIHTNKLPIEALYKNTAYDGIFKFDTVPTSLKVDLPTKPHKKLRLLDTNFFSADGKTRLRFGDGLPAIKGNYLDCEVTMEFDVTASTGYSTASYTPYIQLMNSKFNDTGRYIDLKASTTNPAISPASSHKFKIVVGHNTIKFPLKENDNEVWIRISTGDNTGKNYLKIDNVTAKYSTG